VTYRFTSLRWQAWGQLRPQAHGRLTVCANMAGCEKVGAVTVQLRDLRAGRCEAVRGRFYLRGTMIRNAKRTPLDLRPSYVCEQRGVRMAAAMSIIGSAAALWTA